MYSPTLAKTEKLPYKTLKRFPGLRQSVLPPQLWIYPKISQWNRSNWLFPYLSKGSSCMTTLKRSSHDLKAFYLSRRNSDWYIRYPSEEGGWIPSSLLYFHKYLLGGNHIYQARDTKIRQDPCSESSVEGEMKSVIKTVRRSLQWR